MALKPKLCLNDTDPLRLATRKLLETSGKSIKSYWTPSSLPLLKLHLLFHVVLMLAAAMGFATKVASHFPDGNAAFKSAGMGTRDGLAPRDMVEKRITGTIDVSSLHALTNLTVTIHINSLKFWCFYLSKTGRKLRIASATTSHHTSAATSGQLNIHYF